MQSPSRRNFLTLIGGFAAAIVACNAPSQSHPLAPALTQRQQMQSLRDGYAAYVQGDLTRLLQNLDPAIEWIEPAPYGTFHGIDAVRDYLGIWRSSSAEGTITINKMIPVGQHIIVVATARVREKGSTTWEETDLADAYTFRNGKVIHLIALGKLEAALQWAKTTTIP